MKTPKKMQLAVVTWEDAWHQGTVNHSKESMAKEDPLILTSVGFLIQDDSRGVGVASEGRRGEDIWRNVNFIPRSLVRKVKKYNV